MSAVSSLSLAQSSSVASQRGAGMVEFAIVAAPFLFIGLGSIELAHWFYTRQAINVALLDASRAAITDHNRSERIVAAFEHGLRPLFASSTKQATGRRLERALDARQQRLNAAPWQIEVLSPSASAFSDFSDANLHVAGTSGQATINNDYLAEQDARYRAAGWINGLGPVSGQTIYEANTAALRLSWLHQPQLPFVVPILKALGDPDGSYSQRALAAGYLPMTRQITLMMQSHPVQWNDTKDGKVIYSSQASSVLPRCPGLLCGDSLPIQPPAITPLPRLDDPASTAQPDTDGPPSTNGDTPPELDGTHTNVDPDLLVDVDDPACGIVMCCG